MIVEQNSRRSRELSENLPNSRLRRELIESRVIRESSRVSKCGHRELIESRVIRESTVVRPGDLGRTDDTGSRHPKSLILFVQLSESLSQRFPEMLLHQCRPETTPIPDTTIRTIKTDPPPPSGQIWLKRRGVDRMRVFSRFGTPF